MTSGNVDENKTEANANFLEFEMTKPEKLLIPPGSVITAHFTAVGLSRGKAHRYAFNARDFRSLGVLRIYAQSGTK